MMAGFGIAAAALMGLMMGGMMLGGHLLGRKPRKQESPPQTAVCPVSGNPLAVSSNTVQATVGGEVYYFDNEAHQREFVLDPRKFPRKPDAKEPN